jgi:hypothetical protein
VATETDPESRAQPEMRRGRRVAPEWELGRRLAAAMVEAEVDLLTHAHIVVCTDGSNGITTYTGPFPDALAAVEAAAELEDSLACDEPALRCVVAPLFPA